MTRRKAAATAAFVLVAILGASMLLFRVMAGARADNSRKVAASVAEIRSTALENQLSEAMSAVTALGAILELDGSGTIERFDETAAELMDRFGGLDALALAPGGEYARVVPAERYGTLVGRDVFEDPEHRPEAEAAIRSRALSLSRPLAVSGGQQALLARLPIFEPGNPGVFWGFVIGILEVPGLVDAAGLAALDEEGYEFRLTRSDDTGTVEIARSEDGGDLEEPTTAPVRVPSSTWRLAVAPTGGWRSTGAGPLETALITVLGTLLAAALYRLLRHPALLQRTVEQRTQELQTALVDSWLQRRELTSAKDQIQTVFSSTPDAVVAGGPTGIVEEWNEAAERLFGWSREEMIGRNIDVIIPAGESALFADHLAALGRGDVVKTIVPQLRREGTTFLAELSLSGSRDDDGRVRSWVAIIRDVTTEQVVAQARDAASSSLYPERAISTLAGLMDRIVGFRTLGLVELGPDRPQPVVCVGTDGTLLAEDEEDAVRCVQLAGTINSAKASLGSDGDSWTTVLPLRQGEDIVAALVMIGSEEPPAAPALGLLMSVAQAVTQDVANMLLYRRQTETARKLRELDELKSDFLSTVSHELRTPLTAITGFASTLDARWSDLTNGVRRNFVRRIMAKAHGLEELIGELLDFSRMDRGQVAVEMKPADLRTEIRRELAKMDPIAGSHELRLEVTEGILVLTDHRLFSRVLQNLLSNAAKFSPPGSRITIGAVDAGDEVVVHVSDRGIGIAPEEQDRIFERFYRVNRGDRVQAGGTGIGLAVVKQFIESQGGRVWVESTVGQGSSFFFTVRRARRAADWHQVSFDAGHRGHDSDDDVETDPSDDPRPIRLVGEE